MIYDNRKRVVGQIPPKLRRRQSAVARVKDAHKSLLPILLR
jgi:hypothetical protein